MLKIAVGGIQPPSPPHAHVWSTFKSSLYNLFSNKMAIQGPEKREKSLFFPSYKLELYTNSKGTHMLIRVKFSHFKERCSRYNLILSSFYGKKWIFPKKDHFSKGLQSSWPSIGLENYNRKKFFIWFLAKLDNSKHFEPYLFFWPFLAFWGL